MFTDELIEKEVGDVFGDLKVKVVSRYLIGADAQCVMISVKTTDGRILSISECLSSIEELQYTGDPVDILRIKLKLMFDSIQKEVSKEGAELLTK